MSSGLYTPLLVVLLVYAGLTIAAGAVKDAERSERYRDLAFGAALAAAAYTVVLLILAAIDAPNRFTDAIEIIFLILALFALLLGLLFLISQGLARVRSRPGR
jgi:cytochrome bd-type quinol oxidase subunit 2